MSGLVSCLVVPLLTMATLSGQCSGQEAQPPQDAAGLHITPDELWRLIDRAVAAATQPLTIKLDSRIDTLDSRLDTLDSRLDVLDSRVDTLTEKQHKQNSDMASVNTRLEEHAVKLQEDRKQLSDHKVQLHGQESRINGQEFQQNVTNFKMGGLESRLDEQVSRLEQQHSRVANQRSQIDSHGTRLDNHTSQIRGLESSLDAQESQLNNHNSQLETLLNRTGSYQAQLDGITIRLNTVQRDSGAVSARDCSDLPAGSRSGVHLLRPGLGAGTAPVPAYCDLDSDGGRWTVIQRRADIHPREDFYRVWAAYKEGFGELDAEFWWGLENMWTMTSPRDRQYELRINMEDFDGGKRHAVYDGFRIASEEDGYRLTASNYSGDAGDSLRLHIGQRFTTKDNDQDAHPSINCANHKHSQAGWWYKACYEANINGRYLTGFHADEGGMSWKAWKGHHYSLKSVEMKIRPTINTK